jgi:SAM-dependent methyltransferase
VAARYARARFGLQVFHGPLEDAQFPDGSFDAVAMWDVLEHVHRPRQTLREIHRVLKPNGVLVFRLPVLDSWDRKLFGPYWSGWDAPRHLTLFSRRTLAMILAQTGFRVERIACTSGGYPTFALSLRFWARDHLSIPAQERLRRILESLPVRLVVAPYFYLVDRLGKSTVVTVVARPDDRDRALLATED